MEKTEIETSSKGGRSATGYSYTSGLRLKLVYKQGKLPKPDAVARADLAKLCKAGRCLVKALKRFIYYLPESKNTETLARDHQGEYKPSRHVRINKNGSSSFLRLTFTTKASARPGARKPTNCTSFLMRFRESPTGGQSGVKTSMI